ncbi:MAG: CDP-alcohol phosphatidyltransferase family protein [Planctomycetota bacterium]
MQAWLRIQALVWGPALIALAVAGWWIAPSWWFGTMGLSFAVLVVVLRAFRGPADAVTVTRLGGLIVLATTIAAAPSWWQWLGFVGFVALDLVDGWLARRYGATAEGAVLDMEADQFTVLALALCIARAGGAGHVLLLPGIRYAFVLASALLGLPAHDPKPVAGDNRRGRRCCAIVMVALLLALMPGVPRIGGDVATAVAVLVLGWSFASDARYLLGRLRAARSMS